MARPTPSAPLSSGPSGRRHRRRFLAILAGQPGTPGESLHEPLLAARSFWLLFAVALHLTAVAVWWLERPPPEEENEELAPIEVRLLPDEAPERELPREILHFRVPTHPRVRDSLEPPPRIEALAPPPPDAVPDVSSAPGGYALEPVPRSRLGGFDFGGSGGGSAFTGVGAGNGRDPGSGSFQEYVGGLRQIGLDVVFVVDATGSMGWLISEVKDRVRSLSEWIRELVPVTRFGVVAYRDEDDAEFLVRVQPLTLSTRRVRSFLDHLEARGGGDVPEAVDAGLAAAIEKAGWNRDSRKVILVLGDAPPHPERLERSLALARSFHSQGGTVSTIDVSFDANPELAAAQLGKRVDELQTIEPRGVLPEFRAIAKAGGGDPATLQGDTRVVRQLAVLIFGRSWAEAVRPLLGEL